MVSTHRDRSASASQVPELQVCATTPVVFVFVFYELSGIIYFTIVFLVIHPQQSVGRVLCDYIGPHECEMSYKYVFQGTFVF